MMTKGAILLLLFVTSFSIITAYPLEGVVREEDDDDDDVKVVVSAVQRPKTKMENLILYHMNSHKYGPDPTNMNLGDLSGDLFFDLREIFSIIPCSSSSSGGGGSHHHHCQNAEVFGKDIVLTKLELQIEIPTEDDGSFAPYARCNVCVNGTSEFNHNNTCQTGTYQCDCGTFHSPTNCTDPRVGREDVLQFWGPKGLGRYCDHPYPNQMKEDQMFACATSVAAQRIGGYWYSTLDIIGKPRTWNVKKVIKTIDKQCHQSSFLSVIQSKGDSACFEACLKDDDGMAVIGHQKNISNPCYVKCLAYAALGRNALRSSNATGGMTKQDLVSAWSRPFETTDPSRGGCPDISSSSWKKFEQQPSYFVTGISPHQRTY